jgi:hypothetical protein
MAVQYSMRDILDNLYPINYDRKITSAKQQDAVMSMFNFFAPNPADLTLTGTALGTRLPGQIIPAALSGTISFGTPLFLNESGELNIAYPSGGSQEAKVYCFALGDSTGVSQDVLLKGILRDDAKFAAFSIGATVYLGPNGILTTTPPAGSTHYVQPIGRALGNNRIMVDPPQWAVAQNA